MGESTSAGAASFKPWWAAIALIAGLAGAWLGWQHPLLPMPACLAFAAWLVVSAARPGLWLFVLPAALPLANFSPWTGWLLFEEFDLLVLGAVAGGFARRAWLHADSPATVEDRPGSTRACSAVALLAVALGALTLFGIARGIADAGGWEFGLFDGYAQAANSVRVGKSTLFVLALWPLLRDELKRSRPRAIRRFTLGMQVGLAVVGGAVLWERAAYPGLLDFSSGYRTTALFWEMHVGGAAIDAYLALATPFAAWGLWSARTPGSWAVAAVLTLLTAHACLTTFSRGAYVAVAAPLILLAFAWWAHRLRDRSRAAWRALFLGLIAASGAAGMLSASFMWWSYRGLALTLIGLTMLLLGLRLHLRSLQWRRLAAMALALALMTETVAVIGGGSFMRARIASSEHDFGSRIAHWRNGLALLRDNADWLFGLGLGRLPARYSRGTQPGEFSGAHRIVAIGADRTALQLSGPATDARLSGLYAMTQRVQLRAGGAYRVAMVLRSTAEAELHLSVCEKHLLYSRQCQWAYVQVLPQPGGWQDLEILLHGPALEAGNRLAPRLGMFSMAIASTGTAVDVAQVGLIAPGGGAMLMNRDFAIDMAHWFPSARVYFLPWHIDNLALEILIERGVLGLAVWGSLLVFTLSRLVSAVGLESPFAPFFMASLVGALFVGSVSSLLDTPRIAWLLLLLFFFALGTTTQRTSMKAA